MNKVSIIGFGRFGSMLHALLSKGFEVDVFDKNPINNSDKYDPSKIVERNQRIIKKYQSLVRSAIALDALLESEDYNISNGRLS